MAEENTIVKNVKTIVNVDTTDAVKNIDNLKGYMTEIFDMLSQSKVAAFLELAGVVMDGVSAFSELYGSTNNFAEALKGAFDAMNLPMLSELVTQLENVYKWVSELPSKFNELSQPVVLAGIAVGTLAAALLAYTISQNLSLIATALGVAALTVWETIASIGAVITTALGGAFAFLTSPVTLTVLAIGALIAVGYLLIANWETIDAVLTEKLGSIWTTIKEVFIAIKDYLVGVFTNIMDLWSGLWSGITQLFDAFKALFAGDWRTCWEGIKSAFSTIWEAIVTYFKERIANFIELFSAIVPKMLEIGKWIFTKLWDGLKYIWNSIIQWCGNAIEGFINFFKELPTAMYTIGKDILTGLWNGLKSIWSSITGWISDIAGSISGTFKKILGIHSPSREFMKIGMFIDQGLINGLEDGELGITNQVTGMAEGLTSDFNSGLSSEGVSTLGSNSVVVNLNGSYMFNDKESMNFFMNKLALAVQRG
ncbi:MAG: hypothetical protein RR620_09070 [Clostridium sp.]